MSKGKNNKQIDADILQCKADIFRALSIMPGTTKHNKGRFGSSPPYEKKTRQEPNSQKIGEDTTHSAAAVPKTLAEKEKKASEDTSSIPIEIIHSKKPAPLPAEEVNQSDIAKRPGPEQELSGRVNIPETQAGPADVEREKSEIPRFDLAEEIMAEQRKITAIKRKAPGKRTGAQSQEPKVESIGYTIGHLTPALSEQEQIIAEIVTRDIEKLRRGDYLGDSV